MLSLCSHMGLSLFLLYSSFNTFISSIHHFNVYIFHLNTTAYETKQAATIHTIVITDLRGSPWLLASEEALAIPC